METLSGLSQLVKAGPPLLIVEVGAIFATPPWIPANMAKLSGFKTLWSTEKVDGVTEAGKAGGDVLFIASIQASLET